MNKALPLLSLALLLTSLSFHPLHAMPVLEWRSTSAKADDKGVLTVPDKTGNGYDLAFPSGMTIESDPSAPGGKALFFDGTYSKGYRPPMNLMELTDINLAMKIKPGSECVGTSEIFSFGGHWFLRYIAERQCFQLNVSTNASTAPSPRMFLETKAQVGEWNQIVIIINPTRIELRVNGQPTFFAGETPELKLVPIPNTPLVLLRSTGLPGAKFVGSIAEITIGMAGPNPPKK